MKKSILISILGEKFEVYVEEEFFEFVKNDIENLQNPTPKEMLNIFLSLKKEIFEINKKIEIILEKLDTK
jgi:hypothetical protein